MSYDASQRKKKPNISRKILQRNRKLAETGTKLQKGSQIAKRAGYMASALAATDFVASTPDKETLFVKEKDPSVGNKVFLFIGYFLPIV